MANRIARIRKSRNISQEKLAKRLGVSRSSIEGWENGSARPRTDLLFKLAEALGCSADELFTGTEEQKCV